MALSAAAIRTAIGERLEGVIGSVEVPTFGTFKRGAFVGQPEVTTAAKVMQTDVAAHWFDVVLGRFQTHEASNVSTLTSRRIVKADVEIRIWTGLATEVQLDDRDDVLEAIATDGEQACRALAYPHGLDATADAVDTGIAGGCMSSPDGTGTPNWALVGEDWAKHWVRSAITGRIIVAVDQGA